MNSTTSDADKANIKDLESRLNKYNINIDSIIGDDISTELNTGSPPVGSQIDISSPLSPPLVSIDEGANKYVLITAKNKYGKEFAFVYSDKTAEVRKEGRKGEERREGKGREGKGREEEREG